MSEGRTIGIVVPTRWEASQILRRFGFKRVNRTFFRSEIHDHTVFLCISGVGRSAASEASQQLLAAGAKVLVSMGFCGALVPDLHVGDLVTHRLITVDLPARTLAERRALTERANAVAVDMETQAVIEMGTRRGAPIYVLRIVSDGFEDDLTPLFGKEGKFSPLGIMLRLLNPVVWPLAWKLKKQSELASIRLVEALDHFCQNASL